MIHSNNISIIVPVYNVEAYLKKCVDSILGQTCQDFELILVDDGSPDRCGEICEEYAHQNKRVHVIHQKNGGLSAARNSGIEWVLEKSTSEYISFIDSDDWVEPTYLEELARGISCGAKVSCVEYQIVRDADKVIPYNVCEDWQRIDAETYWTDFDLLPQSAWGKLYEKRLFQSIRYPVGKLHEDEFTTHLILFQGFPIYVLKKPLYNYLCRPTSITQSHWTPRRMDSVDALLGELDYFKEHGFTKAAEFTVERIMGQMLFALQGMQENGGDFGDRPETYKAFIENGLRTSTAGFWKHRGFYRTLHPAYFAFMWPICMIKDAFCNGGESWLCKESLPIIKECLNQAWRNLSRRNKN